MIVQDTAGREVARYDSGDVPSSSANESRELLRDAQRAVTGRCEFWRTEVQGPRTVDVSKVSLELEDLIDRHWGDRDPATLLPYLKSPAPPKQFVGIMRWAATTDKPVAVLHTDLDDFKKVNTDHGEPVGDQVLREFTDRLREAFADLGVPVRAGGEEFSAILYGGSIAEIVEATDAFRRRMQDEPFSAIERTNTCSIGLRLYANGEAFLDVSHHDHILDDARLAERRAKAEGKNRIALVGPAPAEKPTRSGSTDDLLLAALAARRITPASGTDLADEFAAFVTDRLASAFTGIDAIGPAIAAARDQLGLLVGDYDPPSDNPPLLNGVVDSLTWATWVGRAVMLAAFRRLLPVDPNCAIEFSVSADGVLSLKLGEAVIPLGARFSVGTETQAVIGKPIYSAGQEPAGGIGRKATTRGDLGEGDPLSPALLLPIGDEGRAVADRVRQLVGAIVQVVDRPARGGGLPDFWQSNVSRVIRACLDNPNIETIIAIGDAGCARHTLDWLKEAIGERKSAELQRRLSLMTEKIEALRARNLDIRVVETSEPALLRALGEVVAALKPIDFSARPAIDSSSERSRRRLPIGPPDASHRLSITDGLRNRTLADAYPEAVQLIRGADEQFDFVEGHRGKFREFAGFKVVLTEPLVEMIPEYWLSDTESLNTYYSDTFISPDGLFGRRLQSPFSDAGPSVFEFAVEETVAALRARSPTRRINLPISPEILTQPLGLSSIQILPRCRGDDRRLDVLCVWRTVDALVGFPFSAYGSIRWAREFVGTVNERLAADHAPIRASLGTLTYIALSFHMYLHDGDLEIARTIVQDASL